MSRFASDGPYAEEEFGQRSICFCVVTVYIKTKSRRVYLELYIFTLYFQTFECWSSTSKGFIQRLWVSQWKLLWHLLIRLRHIGSLKYQYHSDLRPSKLILWSYHWYRVLCSNPSATKLQRISSPHGFYGFLQALQVGWQVRIRHSDAHHLGNHQYTCTKVAAGMLTGYQFERS